MNQRSATPSSDCSLCNEVVQVPKAWMLDVDGVLISLLSKQVEERLIEILAQRLQQGEPITFNSGRSPLLIAELILSLLEPWIADRTQLSRVMVVGEKGGGWANYTPEGTLHVAFDTALAVPPRLKKTMHTLAEDPAFSDFMEIEGGKRTMMSIIKRRDVPLSVFQKSQAHFVYLARQHLADLGFHKAWKIDAVSDATEIEHMSAGKGKGAHRIMQWLQYDQGIWPEHTTIIEDSPSGIAMAEVLHQHHIPVSFVFTGTSPLPDRSYAFPIIRTEGKYEQGTIEYFAQYQEPSSLSVRG